MIECKQVRKRKSPQKPVNRIAMAVLMEAYNALVPPRASKGGEVIYTEESLARLGRLYYNAWGVMPWSNRLKGLWYMPDVKTALRTYGTLENYHTAIQHAIDQEKV